MGRYYGKKVDENHDAIREDFRQAGWAWQDMHRLSGTCDGIVRQPETEHLFLIEVKRLEGKTPKVAKAKGVTRDKQEKFAARFPVRVISSVQEAEDFRRAVLSRC